MYALTVAAIAGPPALYAGGGFTRAGTVEIKARYLARWDGQTWAGLGAGTNYVVSSLAAFDDGHGAKLIATGNFVTAGEHPAAYIAAWDGATYSALGAGNGVSDIEIDSLATFDDGRGERLYAGGRFGGGAGTAIAPGLAVWDGSGWSATGSGAYWGGGPGQVLALAVHNDGAGPALYAGGAFDSIDGVPAKSIARWDGAHWSALGAGLTHGPDLYVFGLATFDAGGGPALYVMGDFRGAGNVDANNIARWDGQTWSALGAGLHLAGFNPGVFAGAAFDDGSGPALFVGGNFDHAGGAPVNNIAKWDGAHWSTVGSGVSRPGGAYVASLRVFDDGHGPKLYLAGLFDSAGGSPIRSIAAWDGDSYQPLGSGLGDPGHPVYLNVVLRVTWRGIRRKYWSRAGGFHWRGASRCRTWPAGTEPPGSGWAREWEVSRMLTLSTRWRITAMPMVPHCMSVATS